MRRTSGVIIAVLVCAAPAGAARDLCKMLKDKGVLSEIEYNECKAAQEQEESSFLKNAQDFAKDWIQYKEGTGFIINSSSTAPGDYRNSAPKPRFSFSLGNRIQFRYTYTSPDVPNQDDSSSFRVRRFKTFMNGNAFYPWMKYKVQVNWVGFNEPDTNSNEPDLEDALVDIAYFPMAALQLGQYKVPFDRQELTSSGAQQFVDRAITNQRFTFARDQGVMLHGLFGEEKAEWLEYSLGIFNGNGRNKSQGDDPESMGVGRLYWTPMGPFKYSESDTDNTPKPALAIGAAFAYNPVRSSSSSTSAITTTIQNPANPMQMLTVQTGSQTASTVSDADIYRSTADAHFKWRGFSALTDYYFESRDNKRPTVTTTRNVFGQGTTTATTAGSPMGVVHTQGVNVQAGYFVIPKTVEIAGRYAIVDPEGADNKQQEARGAVNWFIYAHNLKLQADAGSVMQQIRGAKDRQDTEARIQFQLIF